MRFAQEKPDGTYMIRAYEAGRLTVNEDVVEATVVITPERLIRDWGPARFEDLEPAHFTALAELEPEVLLLGTGARQRFPHPRLTALLAQRGIGLEVMDTGAACRTYNILLSEGRRVVAALLMI